MTRNETQWPSSQVKIMLAGERRKVWLEAATEVENYGRNWGGHGTVPIVFQELAARLRAIAGGGET